jgi:hypothetical protein
MMATSVIWIYAMNLDKTPNRRHEVKDRNHYAFSENKFHRSGPAPHGRVRHLRET